MPKYIRLISYYIKSKFSLNFCFFYTTKTFKNTKIIKNSDTLKKFHQCNRFPYHITFENNVNPKHSQSILCKFCLFQSVTSHTTLKTQSEIGVLADKDSQILTHPDFIYEIHPNKNTKLFDLLLNKKLRKNKEVISRIVSLIQRCKNVRNEYNHEQKCSIQKRISGEGNCPYCVAGEKDFIPLTSKYPLIEKFQNQSLNTNVITSLKDHVDYRSTDIRFQTCPLHSNMVKHRQSASPFSYFNELEKFFKKYGSSVDKNEIQWYCRQCRKQKLKLRETLRYTNENLYAEFHPTRNFYGYRDIRLIRLDPNLTKQVQWQCENMHEYKQVIKLRFEDSKKYSCPKCKELQLPENSLAYKFPKLAKRLDFNYEIDINNREKIFNDKGLLDPEKIHYASTQMLQWKCEVRSHSFQARVCDLTSPACLKLENSCTICIETRLFKNVGLIQKN